MSWLAASIDKVEVRRGTSVKVQDPYFSIDHLRHEFFMRATLVEWVKELPRGYVHFVILDYA